MPPARAPRSPVVVAVTLAAYLIALAVIAFWPEHVDKGATGLIREIVRLLPWTSYRMIEFGSNILLFVPLGMLGTALLPRIPGVVVLGGLLLSAGVEIVQGALLPGRTSSIADVFANTIGTAVGVGTMLLIRRVRRRVPRKADSTLPERRVTVEPRDDAIPP